MTRRLVTQPVTAEAFAPFGLLLPRPQPGADRLELIGDLTNGRDSAGPRLSLAGVTPKPLPLEAREMERHVHSSQSFVPLDCAAYLMLVAPHGADGRPDGAGLIAFQVPVTTPSFPSGTRVGSLCGQALASFKTTPWPRRRGRCIMAA